MSWPRTGSVVPVGDACWNSARLIHCVPAPPDRISATSAAAARATPPMGLRRLVRFVPAAQAPREHAGTHNPAGGDHILEPKPVLPLQLGEEPHDRAGEDEDQERQAE